MRSPSGVAAAAVTAAAAGAASLAVEFGAVRVLAPWFGQSNHVWANAVGVVLLALALGAFVGGRAADGARGEAFLTASLSLAALWLVAAAYCALDVGQFLAPVRLGGDRPLPLSVFGSLAGTAALFGPPALAMGIAGPVLVRRLAPRLGPGRAAALVSVASTLGGLVGTFATPLFLLPRLGATRTLHVTASVLAALALARAFRRGEASPEGSLPVSAVESARATPAAGRNTRGAILAFVAAAVGLGVTGVEFAAVRALAPVFGQSNEVWAAVLGTILVALAAGYALGGRLAARGAGPRALRLALGFAAVWTVALAFLAPAAARALASGPVAVGEAPPVLFPAVLSSALLFGPPMLLLAVASPLLVARLSAADRVGRAAGLVFAAGTLGSFAGCYVAPLVTLPAWGTRATFLAAAAVVAAAAAVLAASSAREGERAAGSASAEGVA